MIKIRKCNSVEIELDFIAAGESIEIGEATNISIKQKKVDGK